MEHDSRWEPMVVFVHKSEVRNIFEGERHSEDVALGEEGLALPGSSGHALKIF